MIRFMIENATYYQIKNNGPLKGEVEISGAKNGVLPIIAATILSDEEIKLSNVPNVTDVHNLLLAMKSIGSKYEYNEITHILKIDNTHINPDLTLDFEYVKKLRASYYLLGALLGKYKKAIVAMPGGCNIGTRPMDLHLKGFKELGAKLDLEDGNINATADELVGTKIYLDFPSVGATINIILASVLAKGTTTLLNVAKEPHIIGLICFLNELGANIRFINDKITIVGVEKLKSTNYMIIPDQIEAGTFLVAGAITKGIVTIKNIIPSHLDCITSKLEEMGCKITYYNEAITLDAQDIELQPIHLVTNPYPGFPTDMQPQMAVLMGLAKGTSIIDENIFENRFCYVDEMTRMSARMRVVNNSNLIQGVSQYKGAKVNAPDLRAGAALVLAGLNATGTTIVEDIKYIQRGYECFDKKLRGLGADIICK
jgi:UDP-N-acetylglucosamine 1-carboxyvinyltransferase